MVLREMEISALPSPRLSLGDSRRKVCGAVTLTGTLPEVSAEEKHIFKPHKVQQLPVASAWLSATSFARVSRIDSFKNKTIVRDDDHDSSKPSTGGLRRAAQPRGRVLP